MRMVWIGLIPWFFLRLDHGSWSENVIITDNTLPRSCTRYNLFCWFILEILIHLECLLSSVFRISSKCNFCCGNIISLYEIRDWKISKTKNKNIFFWFAIMTSFTPLLPDAFSKKHKNWKIPYLLLNILWKCGFWPKRCRFQWNIIISLFLNFKSLFGVIFDALINAGYYILKKMNGYTVSYLIYFSYTFKFIFFLSLPFRLTSHLKQSRFIG